MGTATHLRIPRSPFFDAVRKSGLLPPDEVIAFVTRNALDDATVHNPIQLATLFVRQKLLTKFQAMHLLKGKTRGFILDHYKILSGVRQDRVGMVFLAEDLNTRQQMLLKVLPTDRTCDPTILGAFVREVRNAARVEHPNVARILDLGEWHGTHFVVTEHVAAPTLDAVLEKGPLPPDAAAQLVGQVALALRDVHGRGLFHRDIKPASIAALPDGRVKVLDLGLTHMLENPWKHVTKRIKTAEYAAEIDHVAPEQAWGNEPDARSDIYGLGSTFFTLLTGRSPFPGLAAEKMAERQVKGVPDPCQLNPRVPRPVGGIVQKMGALAPQDRYQTATDLLAALQPWLPITDWLTIAASLPAEVPTPPPCRLTDTMPAAKPRRPWWRKVWPW